MGRAAVRAAVTSFLQSLDLPGVGTVYPAKTYVSEGDYGAVWTVVVDGATNNVGCVLMVNISDDRRVRETLVGQGNVNDTNRHSIAVEIWFACTSGDPVAAQEGYDAVVDPMFVGIRNNPTLASTVVWSAGEWQPWVGHSQTEPYTSEDGMTVFINGIVKFEAWEYVAGTGV